LAAPSQFDHERVDFQTRVGPPSHAEESPTILDTYANTSSAGSVIAMHLHHADMQPGDLGVLSSFGAGYSIGSVIVEKR
jgi:beta-ketodecanoyl-[acyl-carrier-protein] synthase